MTLDLQEHGFERWERKAPKPNDPGIRVHKKGLWLYSYWNEHFPQRYCLLYWHPKQKQIAIRQADKKQKGSVKMSQKSKKGSYSISATLFIRENGIDSLIGLGDNQKGVTFKGKWDEKFRAILIDLKEEL
jgi:hypothetical protein